LNFADDARLEAVVISLIYTLAAAFAPKHKAYK